MIDKEKIKKAVRQIITALGDDPDRKDLIETPDRVARFYEELTSGLHRDPLKDIKVFIENMGEGMVGIRDIPFHSICEHHMLPFLGIAHIVYIPNKYKIAGFSKFARVLDILSRKLQIQERLCNEVADALIKKLEPQGLAVFLEAEHLCMTIRGVNKPGSKTFTSTFRGTLKTDTMLRAEAIMLVKGI